MKKILVVLTGGTIGSRVEGNIIDVSGSSPYRLLALYTERYGRPAEEFEVTEPFSTLSENMTPQLLSRLCRVMDQIPYEQYEGVIVTHGSDTLSYTAALLGMLFRHVPVPVVLVASNLPLSEKGSNGLSNFAAGVDFIREGAVRGVFVIYQNPRGVMDVFLSTRVVEADPYCDGFRDFTGRPLGRMEKGHFLLSEGEDLPTKEELNRISERSFPLPETFERKILMIRPYPGMSYGQFDLSGPPAAVLHYLYHSATACVAGEEESFFAFAQKCGKLGIPLYVASLKAHRDSRYASGEAVLRTGAVPMYNISPEAAYAKLLIGYNLPEGERQGVWENLYFESAGEGK